MKQLFHPISQDQASWELEIERLLVEQLDITGQDAQDIMLPLQDMLDRLFWAKTPAAMAAKAIQFNQFS